MVDPQLDTPAAAPAAALAEPILEVAGLRAGYGGRPVVYDVDLTVGAGEVVVLLGSNGAGKTTTLKAVTGLLRPQAGTVRYAGKPWALGQAWRAASAGMALIAAERFTFGDLSVEENLALGGYTQSVADRREREAEVYELFPVLAERRSQLAGTMSGGQQRMLSLGVALMVRPRLLLLDEPSLGLAPAVVEQIMATIGGLVRERGMSVLMVEQNVGQALSLADRCYVMRSGRIFVEESADDMRARDQWWDLF
jgi:branched-chain amino acid transport system ATP-binding protein